MTRKKKKNNLFETIGRLSDEHTKVRKLSKATMDKYGPFFLGDPVFIDGLFLGTYCGDGVVAVWALSEQEFKEELIKHMRREYE